MFLTSCPENFEGDVESYASHADHHPHHIDCREGVLFPVDRRYGQDYNLLHSGQRVNDFITWGE